MIIAELKFLQKRKIVLAVEGIFPLYGVLPVVFQVMTTVLNQAVPDAVILRQTTEIKNAVQKNKQPDTAQSRFLSGFTFWLRQFLQALWQFYFFQFDLKQGEG